jgi:4-hydroxyphenylpyruvate dioxygenase
MYVSGIEHIEFYVGNAPQAAHFYRTALGFTPVAFKGLETGDREQTSVLMQQNNIRFVVTSPLQSEGPIADHVTTHGDGVKDIAFTVSDAREAFKEMVSRGATPVQEPEEFESDGVVTIKATVGGCGNLVHSLIQRSTREHTVLPEYRPLNGNARKGEPAGLAAIDHIAICVYPGELERWSQFYIDVFDFELSHQEDIVTEYSAMNSKVVQSKSGRVKFPMMEPAAGKRKSQIEEYLSYHKGPGAQHIALISGDIFSSVKQLSDGGINFLDTPSSYYDMLEERLGTLKEDPRSLRDLNVLVDRDEWGYLMQIFTKPLHGRPTSFFEIIQRNGARGFGGGNIKALFEAIEREQARRGNLS